MMTCYNICAKLWNRLLIKTAVLQAAKSYIESPMVHDSIVRQLHFTEFIYETTFIEGWLVHMLFENAL